MTQDEIIRMAREANFYESEIGNAEDCFVQFAALVAAASEAKEREAVEDLLKEYDMVDSSFAKDFRARGQA